MKVTLVNIFNRPFDNAVAAARTCYSGSGLVTPEQAAGEHLADPEKRRAAHRRKHSLAKSIFEAGHHTTLQHAHVQFALEGVSRQFIWSFLHSHPFYNSEQVSQRYVSVSPDQVVVPEGVSTAEQRDIYLSEVERQMSDYRALVELLTPVAANAYYKLFPAREGKKRGDSDVQKKAQEIARYVLPVGTSAFLYHTVSLLTLLRYQRLVRHFDTASEQKSVVDEMVRQVLAKDRDLEEFIHKNVPDFVEDVPEYRWMRNLWEPDRQNVYGDPGDMWLTNYPFVWKAPDRQFAKEFDQRLSGRTSLLVDWSARGQETMADSVRQVLGVTPNRLDDGSAVDAVLDPKENPWLGETLNLKHHSKLSRTMAHVHYSFIKKLSHTADSQDQRHRMTPASRPILAAQIGDKPDFITPPLILESDEAHKRYVESMHRTWDAMARLKKAGASTEAAHYLLPNAVSIRFTESGDLSALHHKMAMRLCYNAQEEIWRASLDEAEQIREIHPHIGRWLLPPCGLRDRADVRPVCPEGDRYCGVKVWRLDLSEYVRTV